MRAITTNCSIGAAVDRGLDAIDHLLGRHELLAGPMAAALRRDLIFEMHARRAGLDELTARARDVERTAPTRVRVDEQRQVASQR